MRHRLFLAATILAVSTLAAAAAPAPDADPTPAAAPAPKAEALVARVTAVHGTVEARPAVGQPWKPVAVGQALAPGTDLRTGFRARCTLDMTDSLVQVDPLTVVRIAELERTGDTVRTRLHLKQGNTQAVVEKGRIESDFAILTPSATLAVRGTRGITCRYFPDERGSYGLADAGRIAVINGLTGHETDVRPGQDTNDRAVQASQHLADRYMPIALDLAGHEQQEKRAAQRWGTTKPAPEGLKGPDNSVRRAVQEVHPDAMDTISTLRTLVSGP